MSDAATLAASNGADVLTNILANIDPTLVNIPAEGHQSRLPNADSHEPHQQRSALLLLSTASRCEHGTTHDGSPPPSRPDPAALPAARTHTSNAHQDDDVASEGSPATQTTGRRGREEDPEDGSASRASKRARRQPFSSKYAALRVDELRKLCRERKVKVGGAKAVLVERLARYDTDNGSEPHAELAAPSTAHHVDSHTSNGASGPGSQLVVSPPASHSGTALSAPSATPPDADALLSSFQVGFNGTADREGENENEDEDEDEDDEDEADGVEHPIPTTGPHIQKAKEAKEWADHVIFTTRRKGARQTEESVIRIWKRWLPQAIASGEIPDMVVDAHHTIVYLKHSATRALLTRKGKQSNSDAKLGASSLKKTMTMLGRICRRQYDDDPSLAQTRPAQSVRSREVFSALMAEAERLRMARDDFDITDNTILDSQLFPHHFEQIENVILMHTSHLGSIIKSEFSWNWQCSTLTRGDELWPRRPEFGVLSLYHDTKTVKPGRTGPNYNFILPHKDPLRCAVSSLALLLWYVFDFSNLIGNVKTPWDWSLRSTWSQVKLLFGRNVGEDCKIETVRKMYETMLKPTTIKSTRKTHLARKTMPAVMEDMGVSADAIDGIGHWKDVSERRDTYADKIPKTGCTALAGFYVGEQYDIPWKSIEVPNELQSQLFPFVEATLVGLRSPNTNGGKINYGVVNFLELLQQLRPFFWHKIAAINAKYPDAPLLDRLRSHGKLLATDTAQQFLNTWSEKRAALEEERNPIRAISGQFNESATQSALLALSLDNQRMNSKLEVITRRTEQFSPSKSQSRTPSGSSSTSTRAASTAMSTPLSAHTSQRSTHSSQCRPNTDALEPLPSLLDMMAAANTSTDVNVATTPPSSPSVRPSLLTPVSTSAQDSLPTLPHTSSELVPQLVQHAGTQYTVLPLSPGLNPPRTNMDLILPPAAAFRALDPRALSNATPPQYPVFTHITCNWSAILKAIKQPSQVWSTWCPKSLGAYVDIQAVWDTWDVGCIVPGVGHMPPLRLIESEWGGLKSTTGKGRQQLWRPKNNKNARQQFTRFKFFIDRINARLADGKSVSEAIAELETERGARSVCQFRKDLQPKRAARKGAIGATASFTNTSSRSSSPAAHPDAPSPPADPVAGVA
ncbi:hypothetical protein EUX98_g9527 [Antrodiella citrinella]|uniref:SAP domain-containing protein n=1 Tax=Antrodiella citrinella TaxID=2447956 RepID=A0A4V3XEV0_9APHY|nr:hypothetical protein EUX98_g9527 [Antrodiella citrinella]